MKGLLRMKSGAQEGGKKKKVRKSIHDGRHEGIFGAQLMQFCPVQLLSSLPTFDRELR